MTHQFPPESQIVSLIDAAINASNAAFLLGHACAERSIILWRSAMEDSIGNQIFNFYASPTMIRKQNAMLRRSRFHIVSG